MLEVNTYFEIFNGILNPKQAAPRTWWGTSVRRSSATGIETTSLRGVNVQRLFGSQRALKTVEDFTEFELVLELRLSAEEKKDLVAFLRAL